MSRRTDEIDWAWFREMCRSLTREDREWLAAHYRLAGVPAPPDIFVRGPGSARQQETLLRLDPANPGRRVRS